MSIRGVVATVLLACAPDALGCGRRGMIGRGSSYHAPDPRAASDAAGYHEGRGIRPPCPRSSRGTWHRRGHGATSAMRSCDCATSGRPRRGLSPPCPPTRRSPNAGSASPVRRRVAVKRSSPFLLEPLLMEPQSSQRTQRTTSRRIRGNNSGKRLPAVVAQSLLFVLLSSAFSASSAVPKSQELPAHRYGGCRLAKFVRIMRKSGRLAAESEKLEF